MLKILFTAVLTAIATSFFWIWMYSSGPNAGARPGAATPAGGNSGGASITAEGGAQPIMLAEGIWVGPSGLAVPVQGVTPQQLSDTFTQARAGGARTHDAIDIMAPEGTPVVAVADGTVEKLFTSQGGGGITVYIRSPDMRWSYYYAHLKGYAPGLAEGQKVRRGQVIGYVGATGNASAAGPHLHFAINRMEQGERWWQGRAINPYPLLAGKKASG